jgi:hypothetical protein
LALALACGNKNLAPAETDGGTDGEPRPPVEAQASVDRAVATTGDIITYTLRVESDPVYQVEIPEAGAEIAGFRILDLGRQEPRLEGGRRIEERWYKLRADLVGSYVLPPIAIPYAKAADESKETGEGEEPPRPSSLETVQTSAIFVEVASVLPGEGEEAATDIRDVKPLQPIPSSIPWPWIGLGGGALLLAALSFWLWRRRPKKVVPPVPAHEIAFRELDALRRTDFTDAAAVRRFHFRISEVLRTYVEGRFGLNATDLTTEEIAAALPSLAGLGRPQGEELERFLRDTDRVKFADYAPSEDEIHGTYERALAFVEGSRPRPETAQMPEEKAAA